jgi:hypothetical protein
MSEKLNEPAIAIPFGEIRNCLPEIVAERMNFVAQNDDTQAGGILFSPVQTMYTVIGEAKREETGRVVTSDILPFGYSVSHIRKNSSPGDVWASINYSRNQATDEVSFGVLITRQTSKNIDTPLALVTGQVLQMNQSNFPLVHVSRGEMYPSHAVFIPIAVLFRDWLPDANRLPDQSPTVAPLPEATKAFFNCLAAISQAASQPGTPVDPATVTALRTMLRP